ncbi:hypothetical protein FACS189472_08100 [Alphaproteobacteria bacterium]|nr:hypothetical protein FACS189472_08100 [Alphaproteobacteria bacterium]
MKYIDTPFMLSKKYPYEYMAAELSENNNNPVVRAKTNPEDHMPTNFIFDCRLSSSIFVMQSALINGIRITKSKAL